jgi:hypothetical protein
MAILYATLFALFVLTWLVIRVKTVQLLPLAISEKPTVGRMGAAACMREISRSSQ